MKGISSAIPVIPLAIISRLETSLAKANAALFGLLLLHRRCLLLLFLLLLVLGLLLRERVPHPALLLLLDEEGVAHAVLRRPNAVQRRHHLVQELKVEREWTAPESKETPVIRLE